MNNTELRRNIDNAGADAGYDTHAKKLLSHKIVLAHIMHACLDEYGDITPEVIAEQYIEQPQISEAGVLPGEMHAQDRAPELVRGSATEDVVSGEGRITYDILFLASTPRGVGKNRLIINVEAQNAYRPGYPLETRGIYYCSRLLSAQYGREFSHSEYGKIKKVYSIWICTNPPKKYQNSLAKYEIAEKLVLGGAPREREGYDLCCVIMIGLGNPDEENCGMILRFLGTLLSDRLPARDKKEILKKDFGMAMSGGMMKEAENMCNLSQGIYDRGLEDGLAQGIKQGMEKGMEKGMEVGFMEGLAKGTGKLVSMVLKLHAEGRSVEDLADMADVDSEQIREWLAAAPQV